MRCFLVAGSPEARPPVGLRPGPGDLVIAADAGAGHALAWGWPIDLVVGDLDSLGEAAGAALRAAGTRMITAPAAKDETDLELALAQALAQDAREIIICAGLGGRADHALANILLLTRPELAGRSVLIADGSQRLQLLQGGRAPGHATLELRGAPGDLLSLLPLGGDAIGITTEGLLYPLRDETLFQGQARGVSNVFTATTARISLRYGLLLVIHTLTG